MPLDSIGYLSPTGYIETKIVDADGEVRAICGKAADYIEKHGWCQNTLGDASGAVCLLGALFAAEPRASGEQISRAAHRTCANNPVAWNDTPGRTKAEVIARLRSAAEQGAS